jgi:integrase
MSNEIDSPSKRAKLRPRNSPYWQGVSGGRGGVSLGYRKPKRGPGRWIAKIVADGGRIEERLGDADDEGSKAGALAYAAAVAHALDWGQRQYPLIVERNASGAASVVPTVKTAVEAYITKREQRGKRTGGNARSRLTLHVLSDAKFSATKLAKLRSSTIESWRAKLPADMKPASVNRLLSDLRAALNAAIEKHRRELPGSTAIEIKVGTRALSVEDEARYQLLTAKQVQAIVKAARAVDEDFGRLVLLAAATGARFSQLIRVKVGDVQRNRLRVLVPSSAKGRSGKRRPPRGRPCQRQRPSPV